MSKIKNIYVLTNNFNCLKEQYYFAFWIIESLHLYKVLINKIPTKNINNKKKFSGVALTQLSLTLHYIRRIYIYILSAIHSYLIFIFSAL